MKETKIYDLIGQSLIDCVGKSWSEIYLLFTASDEFVKISGYYIYNKKKEDLNVHKLPSNVKFAIMDLHKIMTKNGKSWQKGVFTLFSDYNFDIKFEY